MVAVPTIRNVKRYAEIIDVLVRYGFEDMVMLLGLDGVLERGVRLLRGGQEPKGETLALPRAARVRMVMEELGPTFMKLGQMLSCRKDLVPAEWATEFAKLQAKGPQLEYEVIAETLKEEFGEEGMAELFELIEEKPLAAASMAQVHRARLKDGTPVVLKILRPGTEERTRADMELLQTLAGFAEAHLSNFGFSASDVLREFTRELKREVDFTHEGRSTDKLREAFKDNPNVRFPMVYWEATTRRVLAIEEFKGILLADLKEGDLTAEQSTEVVAYGADAVARQCLEIGLFHADPHPGNLFAIIEEDGNVVAGFIDCGMTGRIEERTMIQLAKLVKGIADQEVDEVIGVIMHLADVPDAKVDDRIFRADMADFVHGFEGTTVDQMDLPVLLDEFFERLRAHKIRFPAELVLLVKSLTTIQSVARSLDPDFDMITHLRPYVKRVLTKRYGVEALTRRAGESAREYAELFEELPGDVRRLLEQVRRNKISINLEHRGLTRLTRTIEHGSRNIGYALMVAGLIVSSAIVLHAGDRPTGTSGIGLKTVGVMGFVAAGVLTLTMVFANRKWLSGKDRDDTSK